MSYTMKNGKIVTMEGFLPNGNKYTDFFSEEGENLLLRREIYNQKGETIVTEYADNYGRLLRAKAKEKAIEKQAVETDFDRYKLELSLFKKEGGRYKNTFHENGQSEYRFQYTKQGKLSSVGHSDDQCKEIRVFYYCTEYQTPKIDFMQHSFYKKSNPKESISFDITGLVSSVSNFEVRDDSKRDDHLNGFEYIKKYYKKGRINYIEYNEFDDDTERKFVKRAVYYKEDGKTPRYEKKYKTKYNDEGIRVNSFELEAKIFLDEDGCEIPDLNNHEENIIKLFSADFEKD